MSPTPAQRSALWRLIDAGGTLGAWEWAAGSSTVNRARKEHWITSESERNLFGGLVTVHTITAAGRIAVKGSP